MRSIVVESLFKFYPHAAKNIVALQDVNFTIEPGDLIGIIGQSGAGKTTLLRLLGSLDAPSAGEIVIDNRSLTRLTRREKRAYWRHEVSFIWSEPQHNLIPYLSILGNIQRRITVSAADSEQQVVDVLASIGMQEKMHRLPQQLSRAENQLAAVVAAVFSAPDLILADEPASGLTQPEAERIYHTLSQLALVKGIQVVLTAETLQPAQWAGKIIGLNQGILIENPLATLAAPLPARIDQRGRLQLPQVLLKHLQLKTQAELAAYADYLRISAPPMTDKTPIQ